MSEQIKLDIEKRLVDRLEKINHGRLFRGTSEQQVKSLVALYIAYARSQNENWPQISDEVCAEIDRVSATNLLNFINLDPFIGPVRKAITAILNGDLKKALAILQKVIDEKDAILGEIQSKNRKGKNKDSAYKDLLRQILRRMPNSTAKEVLKELRKHIGKGVIRGIKDDTDQIITTKGEEYLISGLKDQIYKIKRDGI